MPTFSCPSPPFLISPAPITGIFSPASRVSTRKKSHNQALQGSPSNPISISSSWSSPRCCLVVVEAMNSFNRHHHLLSRVTHIIHLLLCCPGPHPAFVPTQGDTPLLHLHSSNPRHSRVSLVHGKDIYHTLSIVFVVPIIACDTIHSLSYNLSSSVSISYFRFFGPKILRPLS